MYYADSEIKSVPEWILKVDNVTLMIDSMRRLFSNDEVDDEVYYYITIYGMVYLTLRGRAAEEQISKTSQFK